MTAISASAQHASPDISALEPWFNVEDCAHDHGPIILKCAGHGDPLDVLGGLQVRKVFDEALRHRGALLIRGLPEVEPQWLDRLMQQMAGGNWARYREPQSPRMQLTEHIATSTEQRIHFHNENAHCMSFPQRIHFFCHTPAPMGGATPIASARGVEKALSRSTRALLARRGVRYWRNFGSGMGFDWPTVFGSEDRATVEAYCRRNEIHYEWLDGKRLRTWYQRSNFVRHPETHEDVWCNNIAHYHPSSLDARTQRAYRLLLSESEMPFFCTFGDGEAIPADLLDEIRGAYARVAFRFSWQPGDLLTLDNILFSHGRDPFEGGRRVFVAMTHPLERQPEGPVDSPAIVTPPKQGGACA